MKKLLLSVLCIFAFCAASVAASNDDDRNTFHATLRGANETPAPVITTASGSFKATLSPDGSTLHYTLTFDPLQAPVLFAHIHFGLSKETGGVMVFLCATAAAPAPASVPVPPTCPAAGGTVTGSVSVADVVGPNSQGITPLADFSKVVQVIRDGRAYVNVHSTRSPNGEIRGPVRSGDGDRDDRDHDGDHDHR